MRLREFNEKEKLEKANEKLKKYKTDAGADATAADAAGDFTRGNKRFKGINRATKKQFDNDSKLAKLKEVAPPGAKAERMVKHIKQGYAKDGKLTPKEKGIAFATAWKAHNAGRVEEATGDERFDSMMGQIQREPRIPDSQMPPTDVRDLHAWAVKNHKPYHKIFAEWAMREGYKSVAPALQKAGNLDSDALDYWTPDVWKLWYGPDAEMPRHWSKERVPDELRDYLETVFDAYDRIVFDWPTEYLQIKEQGVAEGETSTPAIYVKGGGKYPGMTIAPKGWTRIRDIKDEGDSYFVMVGNDGDGLNIPKDKVSPHQIKLKNGMPITAKQAFMMFNGWTPDREQGVAEGRRIDEVFADQGSGSTDRDNADYMKKRRAANKAGYTGRETKAGTWRVFKDGNAVAAAGPFKSADEAAAWIKKHKQGITEMDKSQTPPGRDGDPRPGPERVATPITPEKMVKHALDTLSKSMAKKDDKKKGVAEATDSATSNLIWKAMNYLPHDRPKDMEDILVQIAHNQGPVTRVTDDPEKLASLVQAVWMDGRTRKQKVGQQGMAESNVFTDARMNAIKADQDTFVVHGKTYQVTGDTSDERQAGLAEDSIAAMRRLAGIVPQVPVIVSNGPRQYRHMPTAVQPR